MKRDEKKRFCTGRSGNEDKRYIHVKNQQTLITNLFLPSPQTLITETIRPSYDVNLGFVNTRAKRDFELSKI